MSDGLTWTNERRRLRDLVPWPRNPRQIREAEAERLAESFEDFGQVETLAIGPNNEIYNGHQRLNVLAARHGPDYEVDVRVSSRPLTEKEREKLTVYLHKGAAGEWDFDVLANEFDVGELLEWGFEDWELGIDEDALLADDADAEPQVSRAEELRQEWGVEPGQLWRLPSRTDGQEHRLICGDCTDASVVERVMGGERADMVMSDPPYNVSYQDNESIESLKARNRRTDGLVVENDAMPDSEFDEFLNVVLGMLPLKMGGAYYLCAPAGRTETQFRNALDRSGVYPLRQCIVWVKDRFVFGRQDYHWRHESILYGWREGAAHYFVDDRTQDTVWEIERPAVSEHHPTMKPIRLFEKAIANSSERGQIVYDPFLGSGTTIIAAENLSRQCRAVEISPAYVAVALQRYVDAFGIRPELVTD